MKYICLIFFICSILAQILPSTCQYVVVKIPNEGGGTESKEKITNGQTEPFDSEISGDDYALDVHGDLSGSKIIIGCNDDADIHGAANHLEVLYQCGKNLKSVMQDEKYLTRNKLLTTLPYLGKEFKIKFDLFITAHQLDVWRSVLHLTQGGNSGTYGDRIPGIWIAPDKQLYISSAINGNHNYQKGFPALKERVWNHIGIMQQLVNNKYIFRIAINTALAFKMENHNPPVFRNVKVYAADPWHEPVSGRIRNLVVETKHP